MELQKLKNIIEALLLTADKPMDVRHLDGLFESDEDRPSKDEIRQALQSLQEDYAERGIQLKEVSSGYRMQVGEDYAPWVARLWEEKVPRYSRALLETLVLIAYRQPITRGEIEEIRGVSVSSHIVKTLLEREWVRVLGHKDVPGKPAMYGTTREFLDYFNLKTLDELPPLSDIKDLDKIHPELALNDEAVNDDSAEVAESAATDQPVTATEESQPVEADASDDVSAEGSAAEIEADAEASARNNEQGDADTTETVADQAASETPDFEGEEPQQASSDAADNEVKAG